MHAIWNIQALVIWDWYFKGRMETARAWKGEEKERKSQNKIKQSHKYLIFCRRFQSNTFIKRVFLCKGQQPDQLCPFPRYLSWPWDKFSPPIWPRILRQLYGWFFRSVIWGRIIQQIIPLHQACPRVHFFAQLDILTCTPGLLQKQTRSRSKPP